MLAQLGNGAALTLIWSILNVRCRWNIQMLISVGEWPPQVWYSRVKFGVKRFSSWKQLGSHYSCGVDEATHRGWCLQRPPRTGQRGRKKACVAHGSQGKGGLGEAGATSRTSSDHTGVARGCLALGSSKINSGRSTVPSRPHFSLCTVSPR